MNCNILLNMFENFIILNKIFLNDMNAFYLTWIWYRLVLIDLYFIKSKLSHFYLFIFS